MAIIRIEAEKWKFETGISDEVAKELRNFIIAIVVEKENLLNELREKK